MKLSEHTQIINQLRQGTTDVNMIALLDNLHEDYQSEIPRLETAVKTATDNLANVTGERDKYAQINAKYWQQLNAQVLADMDENSGADTGTGTGTGTDNPPAKRNYDDLVGKMME